MKKQYRPAQIEKKWQKVWEQKGIYNLSNTSKQKKYYALVEFPYPSGDGLHVGHVRSYTGMDIIARKRRMQGYNVLYPIGWDAFGLPTENYAIKTGIHPAKVTKKNSDNFRRQLKSIGFSFDWNREVNTSDPGYYKWTQWMFLQFLKKGMAYKAEVAINWCPKDKIGLANEEVVGGCCERCGTSVEKRLKSQWLIRITKYAEKLLAGLKDVDFLPEIKKQQEHWIGKSEGAEIDFKIVNCPKDLKVFTTRPDTIFGATFLVVSPEHPLIQYWEPYVKNYKAVEEYVKKSTAKTDDDRIAAKEKTGVRLEGVQAINPATIQEIPVYVADYVLPGYGTGAIMAVPAHDERDFEFAKKYNLPVISVIEDSEKKDGLFEGNGTLIHSGEFSGQNSQDAKWSIVKKVGGSKKNQYKLRDWVFSRQRYWGEPIPVIICAACGYVPVPDRDLPVTLPVVKDFQPRDDGQSPLASVTGWVNVKCPVCKKPARRETDVMPNWAGSSWYFLRYIDPKNKKTFADKRLLKKFMPVDWYNGGMEHVTLHLLYSRFWNQFLYDCGLVPTKEPYKKRTKHELILVEGGAKMSKSKGNVVSPDTIVAAYGADVLRLYEMFMGPFDQTVIWDTKSIEGVNRFLAKVWRIHHDHLENAKSAHSPNLELLLEKTVRQIAQDIEERRFNTAVSACMIFANAALDAGSVPVSLWKKFLLLLAPFAPHITEELWQGLAASKKSSQFKSIHLEPWPAYDPKRIQSDLVHIPIQVNGKIRDQIEITRGAGRDEALAAALAQEKIKKAVAGQTIAKVIYVPDRIINIVI